MLLMMKKYAKYFLVNESEKIKAPKKKGTHKLPAQLLEYLVL